LLSNTSINANELQLIYCRLSFLDTFEVLVGSGPNQKRFTLHYDIFTKRLRFFCVARSERWTPGTKPTDLHEYDPSIFNLYVYCVYRDALSSMPTAALSLPNNDNCTVPPETLEQELDRAADSERFINSRYETLINLYILADRLLDPTTVNMAIDGIRRFSVSVRGNPSAQGVTLVFNSTKEGDGLRILLADFTIYTGDSLPVGGVPEEYFKFVLALKVLG
jgi:hypothetical protein